VFTGRVEKKAAVAFTEVPQSERTIVVSVLTVSRKPSALSMNRGDEVTVDTIDPSQFAVGTVYRFEAVGWIFGSKLAVREVGHGVAGPDSTLAAPQAASDARLLSQVQGAESIVVGRVRVVRDAPARASADQRSPITEHEAHWRDAVIQVSSTLKGGDAPKEIVVRFPVSSDVAFRNAPKFVVGQSGTFLLHRLQGAEAAAGNLATFEMTKADDVLPLSAAAKVRNLSIR
jgi:hypothetical protein